MEVKVFLDEKEIDLNEWKVDESWALGRLIDEFNTKLIEEDRGVSKVGVDFKGEAPENVNVWELPLKEFAAVHLYTDEVANIIKELIADIENRDIEAIVTDFVEKFEKGERWGESFADFVMLLEDVMKPVAVLVNWKSIKKEEFKSENFVEKENKFKEFAEKIKEAFEKADYNMVKEIIANEWEVVKELLEVLKKEVE